MDLHTDVAMAAGARYAVVVVNGYAGLPFAQLERGFAGLMLRGDTGGQHFDPRTVELRFDLDGDNGIFLPLVLDLDHGELHWLDVQSRGELDMNNVESSRGAIAKLCPELIEYFASGVRPSMYDLAILHAAARCRTVTIRASPSRSFTRRTEESVDAFQQRIVSGGDADSPPSDPPEDARVFAALLRGDVDLPEDSSVYALFPERVRPNQSASDLLS